MNQQQRKYAIERIESLTKQKIEVIKAANTTPAVVLNPAQKLALVMAGTVKIKSNLNAEAFTCRGYYYADSFFDFSKHEKASIYNEVRAIPRITKVTKAAQAAKDEIMLGDEYEALVAIKAFEKL